ncbi:MAG: GNAT family N-acetyltransferase [Marinovum sp.]|nr:GNAT family N-acetyltransferase [Marinovum sp.]
MNVVVSDDLETCLAIRRAVFIEEQGVSEADEVDGRDGNAVHLLALHKEVAVGTARILVKGDTAKIGRVAVLKGARGTGAGRALVLEAVAWARAQGLGRAQLGAQVHALGFYEALGFSVYGPVYDDAGIDHRDMEHPL